MPVAVYSLIVSFHTDSFRRASMLNMLGISAGVAVAVAAYGEARFDAFGVMLQLTAVAAEATWLVLIQILVTSNGKSLNPHHLALLYRAVLSRVLDAAMAATRRRLKVIAGFPSETPIPLPRYSQRRTRKQPHITHSRARQRHGHRRRLPLLLLSPQASLPPAAAMPRHPRPHRGLPLPPRRRRQPPQGSPSTPPASPSPSPAGQPPLPHAATARLRSFESSVGLSRKAFRLGKFVQSINALRAAAYHPHPHVHPLLVLLAYGGQGVYNFLEQFAWLAKAGLLPARLLPRRLHRIGVWAQLLAHVGSIAIKLEEVAELECGVEARLEEGCGEESEVVRTLSRKLLLKLMSLVQDMVDSAMTVGDVTGRKGLLGSSTLMASAGLLSALISVHKNWNSC
ncbi:hypothetical protein OsJ_10529 [Oryza sativa Japonica Group]|uniref:Uncharacterized protein n=1 Tax=Oryza sativa subsp. japonica TaxID=39947 RepID=B9F7W5_ORYSJ|nr:hypothetical protein OsJ_10529 [Oryza sativa Japonica Group]